MRFTPFAVAAALSAATYFAAPAMAADTLGTPSATLTIKTKSADLGVGYTWGDARLTFNKKTYRYKVTGGQIDPEPSSPVPDRTRSSAAETEKPPAFPSHPAESTPYPRQPDGYGWPAADRSDAPHGHAPESLPAAWA